MKSLLEIPALYLSFQALLGAKKARRLCLDQYAKPVEGERVLDVGCGPGFVIDYLPIVRYVGTDIDERYIRHAKQHYGERGDFYCQELHRDNIDSLGKFDLVLLNGLLHHIDDAGVVELLTLLHGCLNPAGRVMTLDGCYVDSMSPVSRFLIRNDRGQHVRVKDEYIRLASTVFQNVQSFHRTDLFSVPYDAMVMVCSHE